VSTGRKKMVLELIVFFFVVVGLLWKLKRRLTQKSVKGEIVLITGGASGIGLLTAEKLAREGSKVVVWDVNQPALEKAKVDLKAKGIEITTFKVDLCDRLAIYAAAEEVKKRVGNVTILVNNAGIVSGKPLLECSDEMIQRTMDVNIIAHFWTCKAFLPDMLAKNKGHIVTIASMAGHAGVARLADYAASKFAAVGFDESLRVEMRKYKKNIATSCICPYYINTGMFDGAKSKFPLLMPILEPDFVASRIVRAIKQEDEVVLLPFSMNLFGASRLLPVPIQDWLGDFFGIHDTMDDFKGRSAVATSGKKTE